MSKLIDNKIYLTSKSPRRRELLQQVGIQFELLLLRDAQGRAIDVCEDVQPNELPLDYVMRISQKKAQVAAEMMKSRKLTPRPILAADTTVALNNVIFRKPANRDQAHTMLSLLSGQTHQVFTSITLNHHDHSKTCTQISEVTFCTLSQDQIHQYCSTLEPYDKAGGYAIQGNAAQFISHIAGSYSGIMGLPLFETVKLLSEVGIAIS